METKLIVTTGAKQNGFGDGDVVEIDDAAREIIAAMLGCDPLDMVEVVSPDGARVYCYATQDDADRDQDGAYAPGWEWVRD